MSNYFYKNVPLNNIYASNGYSNTNNPFYGYVGIPMGTSTIYTGLRPVSFGYKSSGSDLSESVTAGYTSYYNDSNNVNVPTGAKSMRVISIGGGGGGGGGGGYGQCKGNVAPTNTAKGNGGSGQAGTYGTIAYSNNDPNSNIPIDGNISVSVGQGGASGNAGNDSSRNSAGKLSTSGNEGNSGGAGQASFLTISNNNGNLNYLLYSNGVAGGEGGNGGTAFVVDGANTNSVQGNQNASDPNNPYSSNVYPDTSEGDPGAGGAPSGSGNNGNPGIIQIIWLYD